MDTTNETNRDTKTGRYVDTNFEKKCGCGHTLGEHTAARVAGRQDCLADGCECLTFKKTKK